MASARAMMRAGAMLGLAALAAVRPAAAEACRGTAVEVIEAIAKSRRVALVIDPMLLRELRQQAFAFELGNDWVTDLRAELTFEDLDLLQRDGAWMVTRFGLDQLAAAEASLQTGGYSQAATILEEGIAAAPDNFQLRLAAQVVADILKYVPGHRRAGETIRRQLQNNELSAPQLRAAANTYQQVWERLFSALWPHYVECLQADLRLEPVLQLMRNELSQLLVILEALDGRPEMSCASEIEAKRRVAEHLDEMLTWWQAAKKKCQLATEKGVAELAADRPDNAVRLLAEALDSDPSNLRTRVQFGRAQRRVSQAHRLRLLERAADPATPVSRAGVLARRFADEGRRQDLLLFQQLGEAAALELPELSIPPAAPTRPGRVTGLVTDGGHFSGGHVYPLSITLGVRRRTDIYHELEFNQGDGSGDAALQRSLLDALAWLDHRAGDVLKDYRITVHFQELNTSKGGPSLGLAFAVAAFSALYERPVAGEAVLTGEVSADGRVLPVGGIVAKLEAAGDAGQRLVVMPRDNESDLLQVRPNVLERLRIVLVDDIDEAIRVVVAELPDNQTADLRRRAYWAGWQYRELGMLAQAKAAFQHARSLSAAEFSAGWQLQALAEVREGALPTWLAQDAASDQMAPIRYHSQNTDAANERLRVLAQQAALRARKLLTTEPAP